MGLPSERPSFMKANPAFHAIIKTVRCRVADFSVISIVGLLGKLSSNHQIHRNSHLFCQQPTARGSCRANYLFQIPFSNYSRKWRINHGMFSIPRFHSLPGFQEIPDLEQVSNDMLGFSNQYKHIQNHFAIQTHSISRDQNVFSGMLFSGRIDPKWLSPEFIYEPNILIIDHVSSISPYLPLLSLLSTSRH
jgi:hypothetical protein